MEKELFCPQLEALYERYGRDATFITLKQAADYCHKDPRTLKADETFPIKKLGRINNVPLMGFARWLA